jgi:hypothetical protein
VTESLVRQVELDYAESFFPEKELSYKKKGRKYSINRENYLYAVKKTLSTNDTNIADYLGISRQTVWRYRKRNPNTFNLAEKMLKEILQDTVFSRKVVNWNLFIKIPVIKDWEKILSRRLVSENKKYSYKRGLWYICKYLKVHPRRMKLLKVAELVNEAKVRYYDRQRPIQFGIAYTSIRESVRSFYMLVHHVSGEYLSSLGITKELTLGSGKYARLARARESRNAGLR